MSVCVRVRVWGMEGERVSASGLERREKEKMDWEIKEECIILRNRCTDKEV